MRLLLVWMLIANVVLLALMGADKRRARGGGQRVAEATLFSWAILGGAWGGLVGMGCFHHKTRRSLFRWGFPLLALGQSALVGWVLCR